MLSSHQTWIYDLSDAHDSSMEAADHRCAVDFHGHKNPFGWLNEFKGNPKPKEKLEKRRRNPLGNWENPQGLDNGHFPVDRFARIGLPADASFEGLMVPRHVLRAWSHPTFKKGVCSFVVCLCFFFGGGIKNAWFPCGFPLN